MGRTKTYALRVYTWQGIHNQRVPSRWDLPSRAKRTIFRDRQTGFTRSNERLEPVSALPEGLHPPGVVVRGARCVVRTVLPMTSPGWTRTLEGVSP